MSAPGALSSLFHDNPVTLAEGFHSRAGGQDLECALISSDSRRLLCTECRLERWLARVYTLDLIHVGRIQRRSKQAKVDLSTMRRGDGVFVKPGWLSDASFPSAIAGSPKYSIGRGAKTYCRTSFGSP